MITQAIDRNRFPSRRSRPGVLAIGLGFGLSLGLGSVPGTGTEARAARLNAAPTNAPLKYPTYLDNQGQILSGSSTTHSLAARDKSKAAYVAFKLRDGATVSKAVPQMTTRSPVGSDVRQAITAAASGAGNLAARTQRGLFLINSYRPNRAGANRRASTPHIAVQAQQLEGAGTPSAQPSGTNLHTLLNPATTQPEVPTSPVGDLLPLDPPKSTETTDPTTPAQPQTSPSDGASPTAPGQIQIQITAELLPTPVPEPGTLAFAGLAIGGAVLREGLRRRRATAPVDPDRPAQSLDRRRRDG